METGPDRTGRRAVDRPLDRATSLKLKLGVLVGASGAVAAVVAVLGDHAGVPVWASLPVTVAAALGVTLWLARGMTAPLREMTRAAARMAAGDYSTPVTTTSNDEVGLLARSFTEMAGELAAVDRQRRQLIATVSHELRTPLAAQRAVLENLVDGVSRPDREVLQAALSQAERLSALVEDLLDLSRLDGDRNRLQLQQVQLQGLLEQSVTEAHMQNRPVRYRVQVTPDALVVAADRARLAQVTANLLDNASRHSPPGGLVEVRAALDPADHRHWRLEVADQGPGISPDRAEAMFRRFGAAQDSSGGTGLGLAITAWVAHLHGGRVESIQPPSGQRGALIRLTLPRQPEEHLVSNDESIVSNDENTAELPGAAAAVALRQDEPPPVVPAEPAQVRPLDQSLFGSLWPERDGRPRPGLLAGSVAVGVLAGALLPYRGLGVGVYLVLLLGGALVLSASGYRGGRWTRWCLVMCLALGSLVVVRADEELAVPAVAMAGLLATTALTGARRFAAMAAGPIAWVLSGIRGLPLLGATMRGLSRHRMLWPAVRTLLVSVLLLVVFGALFSSADAIFGAWTDAVLPRMDWDSLTFRAFLGFVIGGVVLAGCYLAVNPPLVHRLDPGQPVPARHAWEWQVPLVLVDLLFVVFVAAQWQTFFGGHDYLMRTTGLSYATSVHQGFAQLTVATAATLVLVAAVSRKAARRSRADRVVLRVLAGVLCLLTLVVVASALYRMQMYQQAYGFTVLRLLVDAFEAWLGLVVLFVLAAGVRLSGRWVPRAVLSSAAVSLLAVGLANPAGWAAAHNIDRYQSTGRLDAWYLTRLGDDAAPAIAASALPDPLRACLVQLSERPAPPLDAISWNLGRSKAAQLRESLTTGLSPLRCAAVVDAVHAPSGKRSPAVAAGPVTAPGRDRSPRA